MTTLKPPPEPEVATHRSYGRVLPSALLPCLLGALLGGTFIAAVTSSSPRPESSGILRNDDGKLTLDYMVETSPGTATGSTMNDVEAIEFQPSYVIVRTKSGSGMLFPVEKLQRFTWNR